MSDNTSCYEREPTLTLLFPLNVWAAVMQSTIPQKENAYLQGLEKYLIKES